MVISLFVLLVCSLAMAALSSNIHQQTPTGFVPFHGLDEVKPDVAVTLCGNKQNHCAAFGHPVRIQGQCFIDCFGLTVSYRSYAAQLTRPVVAHRKHPLTSSAVLMPSLAPITWLHTLRTHSNVPPLLVMAVAPLACVVHLSCALNIITRRWPSSSLYPIIIAHRSFPKAFTTA